ncbi:MAG: NADH-quinone oxidoreductase subunit J [Anaerolineae bacterium]|nr:NADH-quinone oxidoreductase subunit J [Thermoflexales bacterium]MDW8407360.1 NADH-quinone oxidoreductase subunit J [Anaerolineae bacterium]
MAELVCVLVAIICAVQAIRAERLLHSALWLAGASAFIAMIFYSMGAREVAIIELSVGAGLVTILFVFAISVAGDEHNVGRLAVPRALAALLAGLCAIGLLWFASGVVSIVPNAPQSTGLTQMLWRDRALDTLVQVALVYTGVIGLLGLLQAGRTEVDVHHTEQSEIQSQHDATPQAERMHG